MTFATGIPDFKRLIITPYGPATLKAFHENGEVDLYVGSGRVFRVPDSTEWRSVRAL